MLIVIPVNSVTNIITVLDVSKVSKIGNNEDKLKVNIHSDKKKWKSWHSFLLCWISSFI